jgi:hypothetical protein
MEYPIHPKPLMAHLLPGVYVEGVVILSQIPFGDVAELTAKDLKPEGTVVLLVGLFFAALFVGHICDAIRNVIEGLWDRCSTEGEHDGKWWHFFVKLDENQVARITEHYFRYYELDANIVIGSVLLLPYLLLFHHLWHLLIVVIVACIFFFDAKSLRVEMKHVATEAMNDRVKNGAGNNENKK